MTSASSWVETPRGQHVALLLVCVAAVLLMHVPYLKLAYFWDEAGYYFPAALELAEHGRLIPQTTITNPHPPLLSLYLAAFYKVFGSTPLVTRIAMCIVAGTALYALLLVATLLMPAGPGIRATGLLALSPLFFAQSTMAHLDVAAAAATLLTIYFYLRGRLTGYLIAASLLCLVRETGAVVVVLLAVLSRRPVMLLPLAPLCGWFVVVRAQTGNWLGNAAFAADNVWTTLNPLRFLFSLLRRIHFLFFVDFRWILTLPALHALWISRQRPPRPGTQLLWMVIATQILVMSLFGGATLNRYLLPALALFYLLAVEAIERLKLPLRQWGVLVLMLVQMACFFWNPPYPFPFEENLAYVDFVNLHETAAQEAVRLPPGARVLTTWPGSDELRRPELGYVRAPVKIVPLEDFSEQSFARIQSGDFDAVFMFSNEWQPEFSLLKEWPALEQIRERIYHRRPQVTPEWVRIKYNLMSTGAIHLRGQWVEWMERPDLRRPLGSRGQRVSLVLH